MAQKTFWAILPERNVYDLSLKMAMRQAYHAAQRGDIPIYSQYGRTDITRQGLIEVFLAQSENPTDTLVMLDIDHEHPIDLIPRLVAHNKDVVAPLMFRRQEPYQACAFRMDANGELHHLANFPPGLHRMDGVGSGAIAIQRQAVERLKAAGHHYFFKYEYLPNWVSPSEDMYFSKICREVGIEMYVDTTIETPHMSLAFIDRGVYEEFAKDHPEVLLTTKELEHGTDANHQDG